MRTPLGWFRDLRKRLSSAPPQPGSAFLFHGMPYPGDARLSAKINGGWSSGVVITPAMWIARAYPEAPLVVRKKAHGKNPAEVVADHELPQLLERPNEFYGGDALTLATLLSFVVTGNAYWLKVRNAQLKPIGLWWAPNWTITPRWPIGGNTFVSHYDYAPNGFPIRIEPEDVVHLRHGIDPQNVRLGLSPIAAIFREIFTDDEAGRYTATVLQNVGVPGLVLAPDSDTLTLNEEEAEAIKAKAVEKISGDQRGQPLVLSGRMKVTKLGFSPSEMDLSALRDMSEERVCAAIGIPAAVVGFGSGLQQTKVGATMRELVQLAWSGCIIPHQRIIGSQIGHSLLPDFEERPELFEVGYDRSKIVALEEDQTALSTRLTQQLESGGILRSDFKRRLGYEVLPGDDVYLIPVSVIEVPVGETSTSVSGAGAPAPAKQRTNGKLVTKGKRPSVAQRQLLFRMSRGALRLEKPFGKELRSFFDELGAAAAAAAQRFIGKAAKLPIVRKDTPTEPAVAPYDFLSREIVQEMGITRAFDELRKLFGGHYLRVYEDTVIGIQDIIGVLTDLPDTAARKIVAEGGRRAGLVDLEEQTRQRLFDELLEGRSEGEGPDQLVQRIRDSIPAGPWGDVETRARIIARTETMHAQRGSALEAYRAAPNVDRVQLFDNRTGFNDEDCTERDGKIVSFEEAEQAMNEEHPNGTLSFAPVVGDATRLAAEAAAED
jgi:HK97 family phage portal protein